MAGYNSGRKAPNVSQYLANLNAIPSAHDVATQQEDNFEITDELAQFTNAEFLDFDAGDFLDQSMPEFNPNQDEHARRKSGDSNNDAKGIDFGTTFHRTTVRMHAAPESHILHGLSGKPIVQAYK